MSDPLLDLLLNQDKTTDGDSAQSHPQARTSTSTLGKYLSRLLSLRPSDLTTIEPQSLEQSSHSNTLALQALSSRSHRSTTASSDQLSTLQESLPALTRVVAEVKNSVLQLDKSTSTFAETYSKARPTTSSSNDGSSNVLSARKDSMLLSRQAPQLQDILELPALLSTAIASAASSPSGSANYSQALDLYAHIKRLAILYPDSKLVADVQIKAEEALKEMTSNLLGGLKAQNIRLAAAIRTVGWLRRVVPELGRNSIVEHGAKARSATSGISSTPSYTIGGQDEQSEGNFGALFLACRLSTFLSLTEDALAPLRDLADQETEKRLQNQQSETGTNRGSGAPPQPIRRASAHSTSIQGQQTERYLKRYIEIFREQSFSTIQMYRNTFPASATGSTAAQAEDDILKLPSALASFPLHLVNLLMETLQKYLPNVTDSAARESLLIQVLYAANSLGRLGADFSMMISLLDLPPTTTESISEQSGDGEPEPEWYRIIKKHKVQAARLDALASGQERRASQDVAVR
ncbi:hypothetical protein LTS08_006754 [Lithohypha guttulata]|nr:hypothetical protein LTS08_006754 [Lithohypha guttulata]